MAKKSAPKAAPEEGAEAAAPKPPAPPASPKSPAAPPKPGGKAAAAPAAKAPAPPAEAAAATPQAEAPAGVAASKSAGDFEISRFHVDLNSGSVRHERVRCTDAEDVLGGAARAFKLLAAHPVADAYASDALFILNLGLLSGSQLMTGLRTFFHAYSPLKVGAAGKPGAMWTAGSGDFGTRLRTLGVDEVIFTGRLATPSTLRLSASESAPGGVLFEFLDATDLAGKTINGKIQALYGQYKGAHFAAIGPAGENWRHVRYAAIGLSTENQLKSGDPKQRFCGRGGIGGVMGSKNLFAIVSDAPAPRPAGAHPALKDINLEVARGKGSARLRDKGKGGGGGTWSNYDALNPVHSMPEMNFSPTGTEQSFPLWRENVEKGAYVVKDEACYRCGIRCHKNVYDKDEGGNAGKFRAKLDFEPLNLLSSNIGIFDIDQACTLVELVDELGMDSISCGVSVSYAMEWNRRHPDAPLAGGVAYGDFEGAHRVIEQIAAGELPLLGQGTRRLAEVLGETGYAMQCKGMELPAYLPHTNPGYPFALAGGHMSMRTYLLLLYERETGLDYWVDAVTNRGIAILRDDITGACKFCGLPDKTMVDAIRALSDFDIDEAGLRNVIVRTYLRGYRIEKEQGFDESDYVMPAESHDKHPAIELPYFNTPEFFGELRTKVLARFDQLLVEHAL